MVLVKFEVLFRV